MSGSRALRRPISRWCGCSWCRSSRRPVVRQPSSAQPTGHLRRVDEVEPGPGRARPVVRRRSRSARSVMPRIGHRQGFLQDVPPRLPARRRAHLLDQQHPAGCELRGGRGRAAPAASAAGSRYSMSTITIASHGPVVTAPEVATSKDRSTPASAARPPPACGDLVGVDVHPDDVAGRLAPGPDRCRKARGRNRSPGSDRRAAARLRRPGTARSTTAPWRAAGPAAGSAGRPRRAAAPGPRPTGLGGSSCRFAAVTGSAARSRKEPSR